MKKMIKKFFGLEVNGGIDEYNGGYGFHRYMVRTGWENLEWIISELFGSAVRISEFLIALKLCGIFTGGWGLLLLPIILNAIWYLAFQSIRRVLEKKRVELREEYLKAREERYREMESQDIEHMKAMDEEEDEDEDEGPVDLSL